MGLKTSVYLPDDLAAEIRASGLTPAELIRRGLETSAPTDREAVRRAAVYIARVAERVAEGAQLAPTGRTAVQ